MSEEKKQQLEDQKKLIQEKLDGFTRDLESLRKKYETNGEDSGEFKSFMEKTKPVIDQFDGLVEDFKKNKEALEQEKKQLEERFASLENIIAKKAEETPKDYKDSPEYKSLMGMLREGSESLSQEQKNLLRSDQDGTGGVFLTPEMQSELLRKITEHSDFRSFAKVRTISAQSTTMPTQGKLPEAFYEGEAQPLKETTASFGIKTASVHRLGLVIPVTQVLISDAGFDIEAYIMGEASEAFARKEAVKFLYGTGDLQPEGILQHTGVIAREKTSSLTGDFNPDDLIALSGSLQQAFTKGRYFFNQQTLNKIRLFKDKDDRYLWQLDMTKSDPASINGAAYSLAPEMPEVAAGSVPIFFGDLSMGYEILDREGISVIRDQYTSAALGIIQLTISKRNTGRVLRPEAFTPLKIKA